VATGGGVSTMTTFEESLTPGGAANKKVSKVSEGQ